MPKSNKPAGKPETPVPAQHPHNDGVTRWIKPHTEHVVHPDPVHTICEPGVSVAEFKETILRRLKYSVAQDPSTATDRGWHFALSYAVRDAIMERFIATMQKHHAANTRRIYYMSLEYLMGRLLSNNLVNIGLFDTAKQALKELGYDLSDILEEENDMGLGNGGLGRLAACFLDSLATLDLPAVGYGLYYHFGLFRQEFANNRQVEHPDNWLQYGNAWQISRAEFSYTVRLYGRVETKFNDFGESYPAWVDTTSVRGQPWDIPICGYNGCTVNFLRLWESKASEEFDFAVFNRGGYVDAVRQKVDSETISKVLYPNDSTENGKELRLVQQYFFVSCSLQDIIRRFKKQNRSWDDFSSKVAVQLNDTHPAIAIVELMRHLVDEESLGWDYSWNVCRRVFSYTNHTLLPEALEAWSVPLMEKVLPRHMQIIYEINRRFLTEEVEARWPGDNDRKSAMSIIEESSPKRVRMAYLSVIGSHAVNGVAALHTELLKANLLNNFYELSPGKFQNKTNGITPRRWLKACNHALSSLIDEKIGAGWVTDLDRLRELEKFADDQATLTRFADIKRANKVALAEYVADILRLDINPDALFDVQIKRLHEYKRQHLNLLHIVGLYRKLLKNPEADVVPRVFIFGAKAAPGYEIAKVIIHAINAVGHRINTDGRVRDRLKIVFLPNYSVSVAERIIPAADLSEQISTAGKEASGTGNMKLALNGALTIGTLDGANVEIGEEVGPDNIFIFGLTVDEVHALQSTGYHPRDIYNSNEDLREIIDWLCSGYFTPDDPHALDPLKKSLLDHGDPFLVLADFQAYCQAQEKVSNAYRDRLGWAKKALLNTARVGKFSSDRTIREYARDIWKLDSLKVD